MKKNYLVLLFIMCGMFFSAQAVEVNFQVQMTEAPAEGVWIYIPNYDWYWAEMTDDNSDLIYNIFVDVEPGYQLYFNYWIGENTGETVPPESSFNNSEYRFLIVPDAAYTVPVVPFSGNAAVLQDKVDVTFNVKLEGDSVATNGMWMVIKNIPSDPWPWGEMTGTGDAVYEKTWQAFKGQMFKYTFVYGGEDNWEGEESVPEGCNFGSPDAPERMFEGTMETLVLPVIPFGECLEVVEFTKITFRVNMSMQEMNEGDIVWTYYSPGEQWPEMTDDDGDGIYTTEQNFEPGTEILYYYAYGTNDEWVEEAVPAECSDTDGYRLFTVGDEDTVLPAYFYETCEEDASGIEESNDLLFTAYPNPAKDNITISLFKNHHNAEVILSDITGKVLYQTNTGGVMTMSLPVSDFSTGIYFIKVNTSDNSYHQKILISN